MRGRLTRIPSALADAWDAAWGRLSSHARRRLLVALAAVAALALLVALAVPALPCAFPGGDECPLPDDAEELVPGDALAYLHVELDPESPQREAAEEIASGLPLFAAQAGGRALALIPGPGGRAPDLERDLEPWFTGEAALALLPAPAGPPEQVVLLETADSEGAAGFQDRLAARGSAAREDYQGVEVRVDSRRLATAQVEGFVVIGGEDGVRSVIDASAGAGDAAPLADEEGVGELREELPEHRLIDAYLSAEGLAELVAAPGAPLASSAPFLAPEASEGAALAVSAGDGELELAVRSRLDSERAEADPPFFAAFPAFEPGLPARLRADALGYLGFGAPGTTVGALLEQASVAAPGIAAGFEDLIADLRRGGGVDLGAELLPALGDEAAFALEPQAGGPAAAPYLEFVAEGVEEERVRRALAGLQTPLAESVDPGTSLQAPVFGEREVAGVPTRSLRVSPSVEIVYAVFEGLAVIATSPAAVQGLVEGPGGLDEAEGYLAATEDLGESVSLLGFLDLAELVRLAEAAGLATDPEYVTFAEEFRRLDALGLAVGAEDGLLATDARLLLSG